MYSKIKEVTKLFELRSVQNGFEGLLVPDQDYVFPYRKAALWVCGTVSKHFLGSISSIDDSGVSFHGPAEDEDKARRRLDSFRQLIEEYHPGMPPREAAEQWCQDNGCTFDLW